MYPDIASSPLAIVIPAYKARYFEDTLESIARQSNQNFRVYVGDDCSPEDLAQISERFSQRINLVYHRFSENLGGKDLVAHWHRCIDLIQNEDWIWLFSDDDLMEANCVENFYHCIKKHPEASLLHFNMNFIDDGGQITKRCSEFPKHLSVAEFFSRRIRFQLNSTAVEYIFSKKVYDREGGFNKNDLAWCADDATWIRFGRSQGILTIPDAKVFWRNGGFNISSNIQDRQIVIRKVSANVEHIKWASSYFFKHGITEKTTPFEKLKWSISTIVITPAFTFLQKQHVVRNAAAQIGRNTRLKAVLYLIYWHIKNALSAKNA